MKYKTSKQFYEVLSLEWVSINYISKKYFISYQYIWNCIKYMNALKLLETKISPVDSTINVYKLKPMTFDEFLEKVND